MRIKIDIKIKKKILKIEIEKKNNFKKKNDV